ncbi:hypothetical protein OSH32_26125 [Mycobacterium ulcerans]|uniref:Uncharacterized protein n=1 Tax=Mycobacterium ulcerans TaxID=1809 RepID=A0ABY3V892_MYCUL|nr:hypothetical protein [Mycobacterium ulcerans]UDM34756.1 hypothetical protein LH162_00745 [Mycobacterium ulcerans]UDM34768.1 hypothetical protein LH162_00840 [Mycobacterium ulcerans]ULP52064.1 hypothetical protein MJO63_00745 [Mycobacterium ulcerans]ULP52074.1 hypothetical protein MJO63_00840 [Mycobacterium ulcerans]
MTTTESTNHLSGIIAANRRAVTTDPAQARVVFQASATGHDAVASTVSLGRYRVGVDEPAPLGGDARAPALLISRLVSWVDDLWCRAIGAGV